MNTHFFAGIKNLKIKDVQAEGNPHTLEIEAEDMAGELHSIYFHSRQNGQPINLQIEVGNIQIKPTPPKKAGGWDPEPASEAGLP